MQEKKTPTLRLRPMFQWAENSKVAGLILLSTLLLATKPVPTSAKVKLEVIHCLKETGAVDAGLEAMRAKLAPKLVCGTLKRLSTQVLQVSNQKSEVSLPSNKRALFQVVGFEGASPRLQISVPPLTSTYVLGRGGTLYQSGGKHAEGELWLAVSAP